MYVYCIFNSACPKMTIKTLGLALKISVGGVSRNTWTVKTV